MTHKPSPSPGTLPTQLARLTALASLNVRRNALSGRLPSQLGQGLHVLQYLYLNHNRLSGTLPASLYVQNTASPGSPTPPSSGPPTRQVNPGAAPRLGQPRPLSLMGQSWPAQAGLVSNL